MTSDTVNVKATNVSIEASTVDVKALDVAVNAPLTTFTYDVTIMKKLTWLGGMMGSGGVGSSAVITYNVNVQGNVNVSGSVMDGGGNSNHHSHGY